MIRKLLNLKQKFEIVQLLEKGAKQAEIARKYEVSPATICIIQKNRAAIILMIGELPKTSKKNRKAVHEDIDVALLEWFTAQRNKNIPKSGSLLIEKAILPQKLTIFMTSTAKIDRYRGL